MWKHHTRTGEKREDQFSALECLGHRSKAGGLAGINGPGPPAATPAPPEWLRDCPPREARATDGPPTSWPLPCRWSATSGSDRWTVACGTARTLGVIDDDFQRRRRPVAEHEDPAAERIVLEDVFADLGQTINPLAKIHWLDGHHDPHLRRDLNHGPGFQKLRLSAARSGASKPFKWTRIFAPPASSNSKVHSPRLVCPGAANSRKAAMPLPLCLPGAAVASCPTRFLSA